MVCSISSSRELEEFARDPKQQVVRFEKSVSRLWLGTGSEEHFEEWRWTPAALLERNTVSKRIEVQVAEAESDSFGGDESRQTVPMLMSSLLSLARSCGSDAHWLRRDTGGLRFYVAQSPVARRRRRSTIVEPLTLSSLFQGLKVPPFASSGALRVNAWISTGSARTTPHFDGDDNVLSVLCGRKVVTYAAHMEAEPVPIWSGSPNHAATFCGGKQVEILPGQALYLPRGYWHQVDSDPGTVALNVWFRFPTKISDSLFLARTSLARDFRREMRRRQLAKSHENQVDRKASFAQFAKQFLNRDRHLRTARRTPRTMYYRRKRRPWSRRVVYFYENRD